MIFSAACTYCPYMFNVTIYIVTNRLPYFLKLSRYQLLYPILEGSPLDMAASVSSRYD